MKNCTQILLADHQPANKALVTSKSKKFFTTRHKTFLSLVFLFSFIVSSSDVSAQLGSYNFTGTGACPNQNPAVTSQPTNAVFSNFINVNANCTVATDQFVSNGWTTSTNINLGQYNEFNITPNANYALNLTSLSFTHSVDENGSGPGSGTTTWHLRSSINNYTTNIATGFSNESSQTPVITLPAASFTGLGAVTFRLYLTEVKRNSTLWSIDDVTLNGSGVLLLADPANPTSNSPQCATPGVTLSANGTAPAGETWYWQTSATGTSTATSGATNTVTTSGTYYIRSQDNTTLAWSSGAGSITVTITPDVSLPVFTSGISSTRCQGTGAVTYTATATNSTGITYSLDAASMTGGNSINPATGELTYAAGWTGTSTITASAAGCAGPKTSTHLVTSTSTVGTPVFTLGATSTRCVGAGTVTYTATAPNATGIIYSLDAASMTGLNSINSSTGAVTFAVGWSGTSTITASAAGCNGPKISTHTITITPTVATPIFTAGATSVRCLGSATITYSASATNATSITYSLDALSLLGGNTINSSTGAVNFATLWFGTTTITASAAGCGGPKTSTHTVTVTAAVGTPLFALGATSARCQGAGTVTYTATATNNSGITYSLDATSTTAGNTINPATGAVTYIAGWSGASTITATATGCNGPTTATHTATSTVTVGTPIFTLGATSTRCQAAGTVSYGATASNASGVTYTLDAPTDAYPGNSINTSTGAVTYAAGWSGTSTITAIAAGCNGPANSIHTVTTTPTVSTPVFTSGATSSRCFGAATITYAATATNTTGITYSLDATSLTGGNTINSSTGEVTYSALWVGTTTITASAAGCNGPKTSTHIVTVNGAVATPAFTAGATSVRCQAGGPVAYTATAAHNTGITYSLDAASLTNSNTINASTGTVTYTTAWVGTSVITATATGCNGPTTSIHTVTITPTVGTPVFTSGATSTRCQGAGTVSYAATATNTTGITYSLNAASLTGGNSINSSTGDVTYAPTWSGTSTITASAAGCGGPKTSTHTVTITPTVGLPAFTSGATSTRCQGASTVTYTATATNNTGITYSLDAASITGGNTINTATGAVTYLATWSGSSVITASATGCNGPRTSNHTVTVTPTVGTPVFTLGVISTRCQGSGTVTYTATATNATGITYSLDAASITGNNTINSSTGAVAYAAGWSGTSTVTASAAGCNGPVTAMHIITITPTVGTPIFTSGATSTRCQGAGTVSYAATATNTTGITYSLDAASITGGNTINSLTGAVTYTSGWRGTSTITASAAGCNGPKVSVHTVTITATVGTPVFGMGPLSIRSQGPGTVTYTATATTTTGITYSLDAASITGGNTINAATGAVTYAAGWSGTTIITASAAGCNGPATTMHTVTINAAVVIKQLYLSNPGQILNRIDPVATGLTTTAQTAILSNTGTTNTSFTQSPALFSDLIIKAQTITVTTYLAIATGSMPANPAITALLKYGSTNIINFTAASYNSGTGILTFTGTLGADVTVPQGQAITLQITTAQAGVTFRIDYHSQSKPSRINLPVSTFIDLSSFDVYNAPYPAGSVRVSSTNSATMYVRSVVTDPFGPNDITAMDVKFTPTGTTVPANSVATNGSTRTYEYAWNTPATSDNYILTGIVKQGYENTVTRSANLNFSLCSSCPPVAVNDSASGAGGSPIIVDVLANDYDPNNNIKVITLNVFEQPSNGTGYYSNGKIVYLPNGSYAGKDTLTYQVCDSTGLCGTGQVFFTINPFLIDPCSEATKSHTFYLPFSENEARIALDSSTNTPLASNNIRTIISMKMPYPGMVIVWDHWEDGYEINALNPLQSTTDVWGDGNPYNGIAPGYSNDIIPAGGSIVLDNTIPTNPRVVANIFFDGKDKIVSSGQITVTQVCGEPSIMQVQCMKTNVSPTLDYGTSFTIPVGQNYASQDFRYTSLFIRASEDNTTLNIDKDNNGTFETSATINQGQVYHVNGGVLSGATVTSSLPVGIDLHFGGNDSWSSRDVPIFPATWYYHTYYSPVPTTGSSTTVKDTAVVMLYNSLNRPLTINWSSGVPSSGSINLPAKSVVRFPLARSATAAYKFENPTGESFTAIQICDAYTPGGGGNSGIDYDWSFNLIAQNRLTDFATVAWAPGSIDGTRNDNPVWVTPTNNTTIYVKYDGNISGTSGLLSPCGMRYDESFTLNALNHKRLKDADDNDQSGLAVFTCDGTKLAAVYGEDASTAVQANPSWDVGSTIQPFCKQKLIFANDDYARTMVSQPVTIPVLLNDFGFLAVIDPTSVTNTGLLLARHGSIFINTNGTIIYTPEPGYVGKDTFEYNVCSTPSPIVCDIATVYVDIAVCPAPFNENIIAGRVFLDGNKDGIYNDGGAGVAGAKVYLYVNGNCNTTAEANELKDSVTVDASGTYQFITYPEKFVADDFDGPGGTSTCASGSDGNSAWLANSWSDIGDPSGGFCVGGSVPANDAEIVKDGAFTYALRLKDNNVSATRTVNLSGASYAFLTFSYRRKSATLAAGEDIIVQASSNGSTFGTVFTIAGDGSTDANYVTIYNQDITAYASTATYIRFLTNNNVDDGDTVYIDDVKLQFLRYPQCYITKLDSTTVPANYHTTTLLQHNFTATSSTTCLSPYDFGIAKNTINITGTLFNDANGITDNLVNGTAMGTVSGAPTYAYLTDSTGKVASRSTLNTSTGAYTFPAADIQTNYQVILSASSVNVGDTPPNPGVTGVWISTGDSYGVNNIAGTGIKAGPCNASVPVRTGIVNVTNVNFGVERLPNSVDYYTIIPYPTLNQMLTLNGGANPPILSGSDPEDYAGGGVLTNKALIIDSLPNNAQLYYNNILITKGQLIPSFTPGLFKVKFIAATMVSSSLTFRYSYVDAANMKDPSPATYTLTWISVLPAEALVALVNLSGNIATVKWSTLSEQNSRHFVLERSLDNITYAATGSTVAAAGNSTTKKEYQQPDNISSLMQNAVIYYRVKLVDIDGQYKYSNVVALRLSQTPGVTVWPNPFQSSITVSITSTKETTIDINLIDISGKSLRRTTQSADKGITRITIGNLEQLPAGVYLVEITDKKAGTTYQKLLKNDK